MKVKTTTVATTTNSEAGVNATISKAGILHPLATLEWTQVASSVPGECAINCVYLNGRFYIAAGENYRGCSRGFSVYLNLLSVFNVLSSELISLSVPPVQRFALTHYHSQLVLVGGVTPGSKDPTDELWVSINGTNWKPLLPPMRIKRSDASAVNTGSPEYLVVVGGISCGRWTTTVEVLVNKEWFIVQPLPKYSNYPRARIYNGNLIVTEVRSQSFYSSMRGCCCRLDTLLAPCFRSQEDKKELSSPCDVWREFPLGSTPCMLSLGHQLIAVRGSNFGVFCPTTHSWLKIPAGRYCLDGTMLPTGEILMVGSEGAGLSIYQASLKCKWL